MATTVEDQPFRIPTITLFAGSQWLVFFHKSFETLLYVSPKMIDGNQSYVFFYRQQYTDIEKRNLMIQYIDQYIPILTLFFSDKTEFEDPAFHNIMSKVFRFSVINGKIITCLLEHSCPQIIDDFIDIHNPMFAYNRTNYGFSFDDINEFIRKGDLTDSMIDNIIHFYSKFESYDNYENIVNNAIKDAISNNYTKIYDELKNDRTIDSMGFPIFLISSYNLDTIRYILSTFEPTPEQLQKMVDCLTDPIKMDESNLVEIYRHFVSTYGIKISDDLFQEMKEGIAEYQNMSFEEKKSEEESTEMIDIMNNTISVVEQFEQINNEFN